VEPTNIPVKVEPPTVKVESTPVKVEPAPVKVEPPKAVVPKKVSETKVAPL